MKRKVVHETKNPQSKNTHTITQIPTRENFEKYFIDFYKMFQHCKYNLVALNKKFDVLENFFKNYIQEGERVSNIKIERNFYNSDKEEESFDFEEFKKKNVKRRREEKEAEDNFPISVEDLDFLTKNYIPDTNEKKMNKKKSKAPYGVIVINKKKMVVDDQFNDDFSENDKEEEGIPLINDKNNFNQKLFDYKSFNLGVNPTGKSLNENNSNYLKKDEIPIDNNKWISKLNEENKQENEIKDNYLLSKEELDIINSPDFDLSVIESSLQNSNMINMIDPFNNNFNEKKQTKFSDFLQTKKEMLKCPNSNTIIKPQLTDEDILNKNPFKYSLDLKEYHHSEDENEFEYLKNNKEKENSLLNKKQTFSKKYSNKCSVCKKFVKVEEEDDDGERICVKCLTKKESDRKLEINK